MECIQCHQAELEEIGHICGNGRMKTRYSRCPVCHASQFEEMKKDVVVWLRELEARIESLES